MRVQSERYKLLEVLSEGPGEVVERVQSRYSGRRFIAKYLTPELLDNRHIAAFLSACEITASFNHPNIASYVECLDAEVDPALLVADIGGVDLNIYCQRFEHAQVPLDTFFEIANQLCLALEEIHDQHVIHKDLHPGNIVIEPSSLHVQVIDFGLATRLSREQLDISASDALEGVIDYVSPEQTGRMNRSLDYRTDFYSLGATFYKLLTGQRPFTGPNALAIIHAHMSKQAVPIGQIREAIPLALVQIINKMMAKNAEDRYQSASGLRHDLDRCRWAYQRHQEPENFTPGQQDISSQFCIPETLFGREKEIEQLLRCYYRVAGRRTQLLTINGPAGVGKSALVREIHKPIVAYGGFFMVGKFDQVHQHTPFQGLKQGLEAWLQNVLSKSDADLHAFRHRIALALGTSARALIDFMPSFSRVLGELPVLPEVSPEQSHSRFLGVFKRFVEFISKDKPIVWFIDDLQWADEATLALLPVLLESTECRLLLIATWRDNEVDANHPVSQMLTRIRTQTKNQLHHTPRKRDADQMISEIRLQPLSVTQIEKMLTVVFRLASSDTLNEELSSLATLVSQKTGGNPFFIGEFLKNLYQQSLIDFDVQQRCWVWHLERIQTAQVTDNVVDLMLRNMQRLPAETYVLLGLAACMGNRFSLAQLGVVTNKQPPELIHTFMPALQEGILLLNRFAGSTGECRFSHDRMLQSAYASLDGPTRVRYHLMIARSMLRDYLDRANYRSAAKESDESDEQILYGVVEQFNLAVSSQAECERLADLLADLEEQMQVAEVYGQASQQAMRDGAWPQSLRFAERGLKALPESAWLEAPAVCSRLYRVTAMSLYLTGQVALSDQYYEELLAHLSDEQVIADICADRLVQNIGRGNWYEGMLLGIKALACMGITMPAWDADQKTLQALSDVQAEKLQSAGLDKGVAYFEKLPEMEDRNDLLCVRVLANLSQCARVLNLLLFGDYCVFLALERTLLKGKSPWMPLILICYANTLRSRDMTELDMPVALSEFALKAIEAYPGSSDWCNTLNMAGVSLAYYHRPYREVVSLLHRAYKQGVENGEIGRALISYANMLLVMDSQGLSLSALHQQALDVQARLESSAIRSYHPAFIERYCECLWDPASAGSELPDNLIPEAELAAVKQSFHYACLMHYRFMLAFWRNDFEQAYDIGEVLWFKQDSIHNFSIMSDFRVVYSLLLAQRGGQVDINRLTESIAWLAPLALKCPENYAGKYHLLLAEHARSQGESMADITGYYENAVRLCASSDIAHFSALANERYALYWEQQGRETTAELYYLEAIRIYERWGCNIKVSSLRQHPLLKGSQAKGNTLRSMTQGSQLEGSVTRKQSLDVTAVMHSAQAISRELTIEGLVAQVMHVIMQAAGAQNGALILKTAAGPCVQALVDDASGTANYLQAIPLEHADDLPQTLINYVLRSDELMLVNDAEKTHLYRDDPYFSREQPKSLLCMPINFREKMFGVLYLENRLISYAFTPERLELLSILLAQAAISLENAQLFEEVKALNVNLENKVHARTEELEQANQALQRINDELNAFSYSVSHDLRSPLRAIKGYSHALLDDYGALFDREAMSLFDRITFNAERMGGLIDGLLDLSRVQRREINRTDVSLSDMAVQIIRTLQNENPERQVNVEIEPGLQVKADERMIYSVLQNLLSNAWKYSAKKPEAHIEFGCLRENGQVVYFVKDDGAGFNMAHSGILFGTFQRLHTDKEFEGTGIGLATVKRVINKHGGEVWATAAVNKGATFFFTLSD